MTPEMIELYRAVQGRRGEWQYGDRALWQGREVFINAIFDDGDVEISAGYDESGQFCQIADVSADDPDLIWLPPVWSDDGRCLWAWVDWVRWDIGVNTKGHPMLYAPGSSECIHADTLPEALLRAIGEQEEKHCPRCGGRKTNELCKGNDECGYGKDGGPDFCCEGWGSYCCSCGASFARGQM